MSLKRASPVSHLREKEPKRNLNEKKGVPRSPPQRERTKEKEREPMRKRERKNQRERINQREGTKEKVGDSLASKAVTRVEKKLCWPAKLLPG